MSNPLLGPVEYKIEKTRLGVWQRYLDAAGNLFEEFTSHRRLLGVPWLHYTRGRCPETGKRVVAAGFVAVGQLALSPLLGIGQAATGLVALGQLAVGALLGLGQFGLGGYVLAQFGVGEHVWDVRGAAPAARQFFRPLVP